MTENRRTVAASINPRTAGLWANFLLMASRRNLSTTRALELAAAMWLEDEQKGDVAPLSDTSELPAIPVIETAPDPELAYAEPVHVPKGNPFK